jgi:ribonuclease HI
MNALSDAKQNRVEQISAARLIAKRAAVTAYRTARRAQMAQPTTKQSLTVAGPGCPKAALPQGALVVYTDGACEPNPGRGGWGFVVYQNGVEVHTAFGGDLETTNNRMEFSGILNALKWLDGKTATIHTDSQYCLNALTLWHTKWARNGWRKGAKQTAEPVKNAALIQACLAAKQSGHTLMWCRGHSGIVGNERADRLAALGRSSAQSTKQLGKVELAPVDDDEEGLSDGDREALRAGSDQISMW